MLLHGCRYGGFLCSKDKVYHRIVFQADASGFYGLVAARNEGMTSGCLDGLAMHERIVEGVSGYLHAFHFATAISQSVGCFLSHLATVEGKLRTTIRSGADVRYARVASQVEALQGRGLDGGRSAQAVECIDNEHGSSVFLGMVSR